ncbi:diaminopimelate epimerase [Andreprevotia lacus DSM 23236]|jgi:diaminopimelate epimerase|uniref:Diaminopimelate epimerase n=1 Tax=Andreprevotia lacus DSM 23236 TaxID=1121001 RepID=A0A1W1Y036_9NEIS|nr:diaminopimelate epimerase [Andreprevotia lacus]SMC29580.1 diaminopimelate epimerase [Andreprevotia lacus DSM 23236]
MTLRFTKMQGLGNDFIVLDGVRNPIALDAAQVQQLGDRHFGVGFDQLLLVEPAQQAGHDFRYRIFNSSGEEVEHCGNGARCFLKFVRDQGLTDKRELAVETARGVIYPKLEDNGEVTVDMGPPELHAAEVPFLAEHEAVIHPLQVGDEVFDITAVSMGNPHAVQVVDDVDTDLVQRVGPLIEKHARFPRKVNAGFMQIVSRDAIKLRVYERGAGETLACGTGACAAVVAGIQRGLLNGRVRVSTRGGDLTIAWAGGDAPVLMTGPAVTVFEGVINLPEA